VTPTWRLAPVAVLECELSALPAAFAIAAPPRRVRVLARWHGAPIAWLHFGEASEITAEQVLAAATRHAPALARAALRRVVEAAAGPTPPITVVVCTRDRTATLARCLDSLRALAYPEFEVVVVDNAPTTGDTAALVERLGAEWPTLRYVREDCPGLDWARNRGLAEAHHEIVAYTDDDVRVDRDWLSGVVSAFADPNVMLVTGFVAPGELETEAQVIFEDWYGGMGKGVRPQRWQPNSLGPRDRLGAHHLGVGANMAFRRDWLQTLGGFDTALDVGTASHGAGDLDAFHRTLALGGVACYEPMAIVWHYHRRETRALRNQLRDNGRAFGVFLLTRWWRHERPRRAVVRYAVGTWLRWLALRIPRRFLRREKMPIPLQLSELRGVLEAPWAWLATYRRDRLVRESEMSARVEPGAGPSRADVSSRTNERSE
jgi:glycosyltransferase involved in cell wall biosynthesis